MRALAALILLTLGLSAAPVRAQSLERIFSAANEAYFRGDYRKAADGYQRLVEAKVQDPDVYFNFGLAQARLGAFGAAVLSFERCLFLRAGDDAAEGELAALRAMLGGRRAEREGEATVQARPPLSHALVRPLSADLLAWLVLLSNALLFGVLLVRPRIGAETWRLGLAIGASLLALLCASSALGLALKTDVFQDGEAVIVLRDQSELREGPDPKAQVRGTVREGDAARALGRQGQFVEVRSASGNRGWIDRRDVGFIRPH